MAATSRPSTEEEYFEIFQSSRNAPITQHFDTPLLMNSKKINPVAYGNQNIAYDIPTQNFMKAIPNVAEPVYSWVERSDNNNNYHVPPPLPYYYPNAPSDPPQQNYNYQYQHYSEPFQQQHYYQQHYQQQYQQNYQQQYQPQHFAQVQQPSIQYSDNHHPSTEVSANPLLSSALRDFVATEISNLESSSISSSASHQQDQQTHHNLNNTSAPPSFYVPPRNPNQHPLDYGLSVLFNFCLDMFGNEQQHTPYGPIRRNRHSFSSETSSSALKNAACLHCRSSHVACDNSRPCTKCVRSGKGSECTDTAPKKRKPYGPRKNKNNGKSSHESLPIARSSSSVFMSEETLLNSTSNTTSESKELQ